MYYMYIASFISYIWKLLTFSECVATQGSFCAEIQATYYIIKILSREKRSIAAMEITLSKTATAQYIYEYVNYMYI